MHHLIKASLNMALIFTISIFYHLNNAQATTQSPLFTKAIEHINNSAFDKGIPLLKNLATQSDTNAALAQLHLARLYQFGDGVKQSDLASCQWYLKAANKLPVAMQHAGHCYARSILKPIAKAQRWYNKALEYGVISAECDIGTMHFNGIEFKQDKARAIKLCTNAAMKGAVSAQAQLGLWYLTDETTKNPELAYQWLKLAAKYHPISAYRLAELIERRTNNTAYALYWYEKSASLGHQKAYQLTAQAYFLSHVNAHHNAEKFLAKAYLWAQVWQAANPALASPQWLLDIEQQTPDSWKESLNKKAASHISKFL